MNRHSGKSSNSHSAVLRLSCYAFIVVLFSQCLTSDGQREVDDAEYMYASAQQYPPGSAQNFSWLYKAASKGHAASQFQLGQIALSRLEGQGLYNNRPALHWLRLSAQQDYAPALVALYQNSFANNEYSQAFSWLKRAAEQDNTSAELLEQFQWQTTGEPNRVFKPAGGKCVITLQFLSSQLTGLRQSSRFFDEFITDHRLASLPICINKPVWVEAQQLACKPQSNPERRISCDLGSLSSLLKETQFSHLIVFAERGKANVHDGIMYLDKDDTYAVFIHELAHFAGFIDEYPLRGKLAQHFCGSQGAANVIITSHAPPTKQHMLNQWSHIPGRESLSKANTCNDVNAQAYKPARGMTFMEFNDSEIPPLYLQIWQHRLNKLHLLTPAAVNFERYFRQHAQVSDMQFWQRRKQEFYTRHIAD